MLWCDATMVMWRDEYSNNNNTITNKLNRYVCNYICMYSKLFRKDRYCQKKKSCCAHAAWGRTQAHWYSFFYIHMYVCIRTRVLCVFIKLDNRDNNPFSASLKPIMRGNWSPIQKHSLLYFILCALLPTSPLSVLFTYRKCIVPWPFCIPFAYRICHVCDSFIFYCRL